MDDGEVVVTALLAASDVGPSSSVIRCPHLCPLPAASSGVLIGHASLVLVVFASLLSSVREREEKSVAMLSARGEWWWWLW